MLRILASQWLNTLLGGEGRTPRAHKAILQDRLARDQAFADSGFWDFALLSLYDYAVRRLVLGGVTALSELGWTERALIGSARALDFAPSAFPLATIRSLSKVFAHLGQALALSLAGGFALGMCLEGSALPLGLADASWALPEAQALLADLWAPRGHGAVAGGQGSAAAWDWAGPALREAPSGAGGGRPSTGPSA